MKTPSEYQASDTSHNRLISHGADSQNGWEDLLQTVKTRLREAGDLPGATVDQQVSLLEQLSAFELGRFLLENRGLNAYWTPRLVTYGQSAEPADSMSPLEVRIFEKLPAVLATRERFGIFRQQLQALLKPGLALASIPCGLMGELLMLDYEGQ